MLYITATPIGNLGDISDRALETLAKVDLILCEDTRTSGKLLSHFDIKNKLMAYHDHSDDHARDQIIQRLEEGQDIALISDAGSPLIADPGYKLVRLARERGISVTSIPGPSSVIAALQLAGMPTDNFYFGGFLKVKEQAKSDQLSLGFTMSATTLVFFETANRLEKTLKLMKDIMPGRQVAIVREITKMHEEVLTGTAEMLLSIIAQKTIKGEIVLVIEKAEAQNSKGEEIDEAVKADIAYLLDYMPLKAASQFLADKTGISKKALYQYGLQLKD